MKSTLLATLAVLSAHPSIANAAYNLARSYSGQDFFSDWTYYDHYDDTTSGDVTYVSEANASSLAYVNGAGNAIIKVDNTTFVPYNQKRDSVRITTNDSFPVGSVFLFDALHLPYGCSVWPSFWTSGHDWPGGGEIDIIEGVNMMTQNQMALHTNTGCTQDPSATQSGKTGFNNCSQDANSGAGCTVTDSNPNSYGEKFASAGGGVWATQFDTSGIFIWFWSRADVPSSVSSATNTIDTSSWGTPSAAYPSSSCDIATYFEPQQLILDITLCGQWAGDPSTYSATCGGTPDPDTCYITNVINNGTSQYAEAYFEISYVKVFTTDGNVATVSNTTTTTGAGAGAASGSGSPTVTKGSPTGSAGAQDSGSSNSGSALSVWPSARGVAAGSAILAMAVWATL